MFSKTQLLFANVSMLKGAARKMSSTADVGFIGLGLMGKNMARHLMDKGHKLAVYDVFEPAVQKFSEAGAKVCKNAANVAENSKVVVTMLPNNEIVLDTYLGDNGLLKKVSDGMLLIDSSTTAPEVSKTITKAVEGTGARFIDAPVSGGVVGAENATLTFMVGGDRDMYHRAEPILLNMGKRVVHCGKSGSGQAAKICNNMLLAISMIGTSEAMNLAIQLGLDPKVFMDIVNTSTGRCWSSEINNPVPNLIKNVPASDDYRGGFAVRLITKDLNLAQNASQNSNASIPLGSMAQQIYRTLLANGYGDKDFASVYQFLRGKQ